MDSNIISSEDINKWFKPPKILAIGCGSGGCSAIRNMIFKGDLQNVEFAAMNTDIQSLEDSQAQIKIQLGKELLKGRGAGSIPEIGLKAAEESQQEIEEILEDTELLFLTTGMGGGTGTGALPFIARLAKERNIPTIAIVTKPLDNEGGKIRDKAEQGIAELKKYVKSVIVVPLQNLFKLADDETSYEEALNLSSDILYIAMKGITDVMNKVSKVKNIDLNDIKSLMEEDGKIFISTGESILTEASKNNEDDYDNGEYGIISAVDDALLNPLLEENNNIEGATKVIATFTTSTSATFNGIEAGAQAINLKIGNDNVSFKYTQQLDKNLPDGVVRVFIFAAGIPEQKETKNAVKTNKNDFNIQEQLSSHTSSIEQAQNDNIETNSKVLNDGKISLEQMFSQNNNDNIVNNSVGDFERINLSSSRQNDEIINQHTSLEEKNLDIAKFDKNEEINTEQRQENNNNNNSFRQDKNIVKTKLSSTIKKNTSGQLFDLSSSNIAHRDSNEKSLLDEDLTFFDFIGSEQKNEEQTARKNPTSINSSSRINSNKKKLAPNPIVPNVNNNSSSSIKPKIPLNEKVVKIKNGEIEFKNIQQANGLNDDILNVPAFLRNNNKFDSNYE